MKTKKNSEPNKFSFDELSKSLKEYSIFGGTLDEEGYGEIKEWISTGNYSLNALISGDIFKGIPSGKITVFSGPSQTGKTFLALNTAREAQRMGYDIIWLDSENAFNKEQAIENFGIQPDKFRHELVNSIEEVSTYCKNLTEVLLKKKEEGFELPKVLIVLDSLGNLSTEKEIGDVLSNSEKVDMTRAKGIKKFFRVMTVELAKLDIPMICINHVYSSIGYITQNVQSGGTGVEYLPSVNVELSRAQLKENPSVASSNRIGVQVTAKLVKGRFSAPLCPVKFQILFTKGMNKYIGLECFLDENTFEKIGFGPGKTLKGTGVYTYSKEIPTRYWSLTDGTVFEYTQVYVPEFWTDERLIAINEVIHEKTSYRNESMAESFKELIEDTTEDNLKNLDENSLNSNNE